MKGMRTNIESIYAGAHDTRRRTLHKKNRVERSTFTISGTVAFLAALFIVFGILVTGSFQSLAQDEFGTEETYYKSITIEKGDTLWSIAEEYITDDFDSIEEYISVLKNMNNLKNDRIFFGDKLIVTYNPKL